MQSGQTFRVQLKVSGGVLMSATIKIHINYEDQKNSRTDGCWNT